MTKVNDLFTYIFRGEKNMSNTFKVATRKSTVNVEVVLDDHAEVFEYSFLIGEMKYSGTIGIYPLECKVLQFHEFVTINETEIHSDILNLILDEADLFDQIECQYERYLEAM